MKKFINAILVVEGTHDKCRIETYFDVLDFVITNGFSIDKEELDYLLSIQDKENIIILTDSDKAGLEIRNKINNVLTKAINISLDITKCNKNHKHGVAEASFEELMDKLSPYISNEVINDSFSKADMFLLGYSGNSESKIKRIEFCNKNKLGNCSSNSFIRRCTIKKITREQLIHGN